MYARTMERATRQAPRFMSYLTERIIDYSLMPQKSLTLKQMMTAGTPPITPRALLSSAQWLYKELPIRLAKRVRELESLPYGLSAMGGVEQVRGWYEHSFRDILTMSEPQTDQDELDFTSVLSTIYERHNKV